MPELTIRLSEDVHTALLTTADVRGRTVDDLVEESLEKAGLLSSPMDGMLSGRFRFLFSSALFEEYCDVLSRPKLRKYHRRTEEQIEGILNPIRAHATWFNPEPSPLTSLLLMR